MGKPTLVIPGNRICSLEDFYTVMGEVIKGPGGYFGRNLDSLRDCLAGGFGTPNEDYLIRWIESASSRDSLGYAETIRQLRARLPRCHPSNRAEIEGDIARAERGEGPTVFDWLVEIIRESPHVDLLLE